MKKTQASCVSHGIARMYAHLPSVQWPQAKHAQQYSEHAQIRKHSVLTTAGSNMEVEVFHMSEHSCTHTGCPHPGVLARKTWRRRSNYACSSSTLPSAAAAPAVSLSFSSSSVGTSTMRKPISFSSFKDVACCVELFRIDKPGAELRRKLRASKESLHLCKRSMTEN